MAIGVYDEHAFIIENNEKLAKVYEHCHSRFTQAGPNISWRLLKPPETNFKKAFFPEHSASIESARWIEKKTGKTEQNSHSLRNVRPRWRALGGRCRSGRVPR